MFTLNDFIKGFSFLTDINAKQESDEIHVYSLETVYADEAELDSDNGTVVETELFSISCSEALKSIEKLNSVGFSIKDNYLFNGKIFEIPVVEFNSRSLISIQRMPERYVASRNGCEISISKATNDYIYALICSLPTMTKQALDTVNSMNYSLKPDKVENLFSRIITVKFSAERSYPPNDIKRMISAYLVNLSFSFNIVFSIEGYLRRQSRIVTVSKRGGQLFPFRLYNQGLVAFYNQAIVSDMPFTKYLAFYHVAESFFITISESVAFEEIKDRITKPSFSPYAEEDIRQFYDYIKKKIREQRDDGAWNERTGLMLCLNKYVPDLESLERAIKAIDRTAIEYYKSTSVEFASGAKTIDFSAPRDIVYSNIRDRVYSVRNAIVHSKEEGGLRYEPFKHDKQLQKEIALIRAIAEEIIINSASENNSI